MAYGHDPHPDWKEILKWFGEAMLCIVVGITLLVAMAFSIAFFLWCVKTFAAMFGMEVPYD